jgi:formylglycine-generating enzyme required for sulfatase activity
MAHINGGEYSFVVHGVQVEGAGGLAGPDDRSQPDVQFPWEDQPIRQHSHVIDVADFLIDIHPVTNERYAVFLKATGWRPPTTSQNWLAHWERADGGQEPTMKAGKEQQPVRWVSRPDAEAFCAHEGKRLPHSWEWQLAAQGFTNHSYPWGEDWKDTAVPKRVTANEMGEPPAVGQHPLGASKAGVEDMVGVIWQLSDRMCDLHTCRTIVRGGNWWAPKGSAWYFPPALRLDEQNTWLELSESMDRSAGIGFRCVADAQ